jgi:hypothetical protein
MNTKFKLRWKPLFEFCVAGILTVPISVKSICLIIQPAVRRINDSHCLELSCFLKRICNTRMYIQILLKIYRSDTEIISTLCPKLYSSRHFQGQLYHCVSSVQPKHKGQMSNTNVDRVWTLVNSDRRLGVRLIAKKRAHKFLAKKIHYKKGPSTSFTRFSPWFLALSKIKNSLKGQRSADIPDIQHNVKLLRGIPGKQFSRTIISRSA